MIGASSAVGVITAGFFAGPGNDSFQAGHTVSRSAFTTAGCSPGWVRRPPSPAGRSGPRRFAVSPMLGMLASCSIPWAFFASPSSLIGTHPGQMEGPVVAGRSASRTRAAAWRVHHAHPAPPAVPATGHIGGGWGTGGRKTGDGQAGLLPRRENRNEKRPGCGSCHN